jgi:hypothetical protein
MARKWEIPDSDAVAADRTDEHVRRLREMLALMAPDTGASALGATFTGGAEPAPAQQALMLPSPRAIGDL